MYRVRAVTRNPDCEAVRILQAKGAEIVRADLTVPSTLSTALAGCWGIFLVTNFYDGEGKWFLPPFGPPLPLPPL